MIDLSPPPYGPLSPNFQKRLPDLFHGDRAALNQADNHSHVSHHSWVLRFGQNLSQLRRTLCHWVVIACIRAIRIRGLSAGRRIFSNLCVVGWNLGRTGSGILVVLRRRRDTANRQRCKTIAPLIEDPLLIRVLPVIGPAAPIRFLSVALLSASKRTVNQVQLRMVPLVGEKKDAALPASDQAMSR